MSHSPEKINAIHADFVALRAQLQREGLFEVPAWRIAIDIALHVILFSLAGALSFSSPVAGFVLATVASINLVWWIHDCGHDAFFASKEHSRLAIEALGVVLLGMPQIEYHYGIHRRHHGFTNVLGKDTALETGPVIWSPEMATAKLRGFLPFQTFFWILFVLPLTYPLITFRCLQLSWQKRHYGRLAFFFLRWVIALFVLQLSFTQLAGPVFLAGFVLGFTASLNHFSMPISKVAELPFPGQVYLVTQNLKDDSRFITWLTGGLNSHVEHHLFPTMPSRNLSKIRQRVKAFAEKHNLPYHSSDKLAAALQLIDTLEDPLLVRTFRREIL